MSKIHIGIGTVTVPLIDYAVGAAAVLGIRDSGKTVTTKGIVEQLLDNKIPVVVFDAVGKWRWLKTASPGGKAYNVVVAGGRVPDLPLTVDSVKEIVRSAVKERIPLVIDLFDKNLSKADWKRIVKTAVHIIHYENEGGPIHIVLEEAAEFVPQRVIDGDVYAEIEKVVRMGGNAGVGITLINQRSQEVNKAVLEQCTTLILGCQIGNKAIEAVGKWVERLDSEIADKVLTSLPKLKAGEAWVWTRQNPDHPSREQMPMCRSHHPDRRESSEVKVEGLKSSDPGEFIAKLQASIPKVIEQAKANDPAELRKEISKLKAELSRAENNLGRRDEEVTRAYDMGKRDGDKHPTVTPKDLTEFSTVISVAMKTIMRVHDEIVGKINQCLPNPNYRIATIPAEKRTLTEPIIFKRTKPVTHAAPENGRLPKAEAAILNVVASYGTCSIKKAALFTGYSMNGGGFRNALGALRSKGYIVRGDRLVITEEGQRAAQPIREIPAGIDLFNMWMKHPELGHAEREILRVLYETTREMDIESLAASTTSATGEPYAANGGGFRNALGKLRGLELISGSRGSVRLAEEFNS